MRAKSLFEIFNRHMPSPNAIEKAGLEATLRGEKEDPDYIKTHFSELVLECEDNAHQLFKEAQAKAWRKSVDKYFQSSLTDSVEKQKLDFVNNGFQDLNSFFLSLSQSRKSRGGSAFQNILEELLSRCDYVFQAQPKDIDSIPDFLFPSVEHYKENAIDCIIFTAKRVIRERWRQVVTEGTRGLGFYLATIDDRVTKNAINNMHENRVILVVPEALKTGKKNYLTAQNVISFETFFRDVLDPAMIRWRNNRII
jgi:hypothetical protein